MDKTIVYSVPEFVEVSYRRDLEAVYLKWHSEYDEGSAVRDAVFAAVDFVNRNGVQNWLADISTSTRGLSHEDMEWVASSEFSDAISQSPLRKFVMIPPLPETGQDTDWLSDWERNTLAKFGNGVQAKLSDDINEIRDFFRKAE